MTLPFMADNKPKRQHTVTNNILKNFCNQNGLLWVFDRKENEYREQHPDDTTVIRDFYTYTTVDGEKCYELETTLGDLLESKLPAIVSKLEQSQPIDRREKETLAAFAALQQQKTSAARSEYVEMMKETHLSTAKMMFSDKQFVEHTIEKFNRSRKAGESKIEETPQSMMDFVDTLGKENIEIPKESHIQMMLKLAAEISGLFMHLDWVFLKAPDNSSFVTSDNPFSLIGKPTYPFDGVGILTPGAEKTLPLSPKICLMMLNMGNNVWGHEISRKHVRGINCRAASNCDRYLIARDKPLLERLVKITKINTIPRRSQMVVSTPFNRS